MAANAIAEDQVEMVNMGSDMNQLLTGQADAVIGWLTNTVALSILGDDCVDLRLWDADIQLYADVYYATDDTIANDPELLAGFLPCPAGAGYAENSSLKRSSLTVSHHIHTINKA